MWHGILVVIHCWKNFESPFTTKGKFHKVTYRSHLCFFFILAAFPSPFSTSRHCLDILLHELVLFWIIDKWNCIVWTPESGFFWLYLMFAGFLYVFVYSCSSFYSLCSLIVYSINIPEFILLLLIGIYIIFFTYWLSYFL